MTAKLISIGKSKGIRLPQSVVDKCGLEDEIELEVQGSRLIVRASKSPRRGWNAAFAKMRASGDDRLLEN